MPTKTYKVRIKPGVKHGAEQQYRAGDELEVTEAELRSFGDKFELVDQTPKVHEPPAGETPEPADAAVEQVDAQVAAVIARLEERFGPQIQEEVEPETIERLQERMANGGVPTVEEVVGTSMAKKLEREGLGDPVVIYYAEDGDLTAIKGLGPGTLLNLRRVYGKAGD